MTNTLLNERINTFLDAIGLRDDDGDYLASVRQIGNTRAELYLHTNPEDAAKRIETRTGMKADFEYTPEGAYWNYNIEGFGYFYLERYCSSSLYMTIVNK